MEYKNSNICELVAKKLGYPKRVVVAKKNDSKQIDLDKNKFNLSEWYGFTSDNGKIIRLNVNQTPAKNGNYNFYPKEKVFDEESDQYIVVRKEQKIYYLKIAQKSYTLDEQWHSPGGNRCHILRGLKMTASALPSSTNSTRRFSALPTSSSTSTPPRFRRWRSSRH